MATIEEKFRALSVRLDEGTLRTLAAKEARSLGRGGVSLVAKATGLSRTTIYAGLAELQMSISPQMQVGSERKRIRAVGGGRKKLVDKDAGLLDALDALVDPVTRGDPMSPLRWTCKSTYRLSEELNRKGYRISQRTVCDLLSQAGFSLQSTRKTREGAQHEDRDTQFVHIAQTVAEYQTSGDPVISVDTKKKELIGDFKNAGREWRPHGEPEQVRIHDFITANWRGRPLLSRQVVVNLIGSTKTRNGLNIKAAIDENAYEKGIKVSDQELATLAIERDNFHGEWNYRLLPRNAYR